MTCPRQTYSPEEKRGILTGLDLRCCSHQLAAYLTMSRQTCCDMRDSDID